MLSLSYEPWRGSVLSDDAMHPRHAHDRVVGTKAKILTIYCQPSTSPQGTGGRIYLNI